MAVDFAEVAGLNTISDMDSSIFPFQFEVGLNYWGHGSSEITDENFKVTVQVYNENINKCLHVQ